MREYEAIEQMLGNQKKLILSAPEAGGHRGRADVRNSAEFIRVLRQELANYVSREQYEVMKDKFVRKVDENKGLLGELRKMEKDIKWVSR